MMHAILIEAVLKNGTLLLSRCRDFLAMFPQTSSVLVTREMAYDYQERYRTFQLFDTFPHHQQTCTSHLLKLHVV